MTAETDQVLIVFCTCPERITAESIAKQVVEQKFAACVNIINDITSVYVWDDEGKMEPEVQLLIKTTTARMDALKAFILEDNMKNIEAARTEYEKFIENHPDHHFVDDAKFSLNNLGKTNEEIQAELERLQQQNREAQE